MPGLHRGYAGIAGTLVPNFAALLPAHMLFNSLSFLVFFGVVAGGCFALPARLRGAWLLGASYYFYASWQPAYVGLLAASTLLAYVGGVRMGQPASRQQRRRWLCISLTGLLLLLLVFNYLLPAWAVRTGEASPPGWPLVAPVGLAFYTLQVVGYCLDVYGGRLAAEQHLGRFALFVAFWPKLLAGPLERGRQLLPQLRRAPGFAYGRVASGLRLMAWGLFKKVVIADRLALMVDPVFDHVRRYQGLVLWLATGAFALQLYADLAGYTDLARGSARVLGYELAINFRQPYFATSVRDFWRRWHCSLTSWFRRYLYRPLAGTERHRGRTAGAVLLVGVAGGLWHEASWTLLAWGALHSGYLLAEAGLRPARTALTRLLGLTNWPHLRRGLGTAVTGLLVGYTWVFFRAQSLADALYVSTHLCSGWPTTGHEAALTVVRFTLSYPPELLVTAAVLVPLLAADVVQEFPELAARVGRPPAPVRWAAYAALLLALVLLGYFTNTPFYYFRF